MVDEILVSASAKDEIVKVLGMEHSSRMRGLHIRINGVEQFKNVIVDEIEISITLEDPKKSELEKKQ
jgi:hypothetical protein